MSWRPDGWKPFCEPGTSITQWSHENYWRERGADAILEAQRDKGIRITVAGKPKDEGARGNNPVRIVDSDGYEQMLWPHWVRELGLEPTMKGTLAFIPEE